MPPNILELCRSSRTRAKWSTLIIAVYRRCDAAINYIQSFRRLIYSNLTHSLVFNRFHYIISAMSEIPGCVNFSRSFAKLNNISSIHPLCIADIERQNWWHKAEVPLTTNMLAKVCTPPTVPHSTRESINNEIRKNENNGRVPWERRECLIFHQ